MVLLMTVADGNAHVATQDKVVSKSRKHHEATSERALERIPSLVRAFNSASVC